MHFDLKQPDTLHDPTSQAPRPASRGLMHALMRQNAGGSGPHDRASVLQGWHAPERNLLEQHSSVQLHGAIWLTVDLHRKPDADSGSTAISLALGLIVHALYNVGRRRKTSIKRQKANVKKLENAAHSAIMAARQNILLLVAFACMYSKLENVS